MVQAETEQRPHKVSFYIKKNEAQHVMEALSKSLEKRGVTYSSFILILSSTILEYLFVLK